ncbi:MAG: ABC transporter permease [Acidimicrobiia bacterium]|nr:ABC transporter permease [Acidimicrobiia bacterium]
MTDRDPRSEDRASGADTPPPESEEWADQEPQSRTQALIDDLAGIGIDWRGALLVPALALVTALLVSGFIIVVTDIELWRNLGFEALGNTLAEVGRAYKTLFTGSMGSLRAISETLVSATPLILAGLAVAIGFRAGLFNIGAEGQIIIGGVFSLGIGIALDVPIVLALPLAILFGMLGGAIWGGIPGWLRAKTGAHEVITTIMLNNVAIFLLPWLLKTSFFQVEGRNDPVSKTLEIAERFPRMLGFLDRTDLRVHAGIIVAFLAAWAIYWLLFRSTMGFEFRAVGFNPDGARYAGMNVTRSYVLVMAIAGAMAGLGGTTIVNGVLYQGTPGFSAGLGFEAISLALLGRSHPVGVVAAGLLFGALRAGGQEMQAGTDVPIDLILVVQALVVVFIAAPALIRAIYRVKTGKAAEQLTTGWAT